MNMKRETQKKPASSPNLGSNDLFVEPPPHVTGNVTKDLIMKYTFVALCVLVAMSFLSWGIVSLILSVISVLVAISIDYLLSLVMKERGPLNTMSAAVFGLIVALSYSLGIPAAFFRELLPLSAPMAYAYVAIIAAMGMILFKKGQGLLGRKYVNPAATAKLLVFLPFLQEVFLTREHTLMLPSLTSPIAFQGQFSFAVFLQSCFANVPLTATTTASPSDVLWTLGVLKLHGWVGGASSLAVIVVGIALILFSRGYIKWRIPLTYLATTALFAFVLSFVYGGDPLLRVSFHLFVGSSIFLAFFMATDPATTPLTGLGQIIFAVGVGMLTVAFQTWVNFLGGSILALVIMNLTVPLLDRVGIHKPFGRR
jgi:electron transport complex protein RnfD